MTPQIARTQGSVADEQEGKSEHARGGVFRAVVVGRMHDIPYVLQHPALASGNRFEIVGLLAVEDSKEGLAAAVREQVQMHQADTLLAAGGVGRGIMDALGELAISLDCRLLTLLSLSPPAGLDPVVIWEGEHPLIQLAMTSDRRVRHALKRGLDLFMAAFGLVVAAPILLLASLAVMVDSGGSPLFGHVRIGRGGRRFKCWKLRTMAQDAEERLRRDRALLEAYQNNDFKLPDQSDPRITRVGRLLRQSSLDELPQLWNVLVGDMSMVGPRPLVADELRHYEGHVLTLLSVRPGLTGAWAVSGRHHLAYPQRTDVELEYVRSHTLVTDLRILMRTASAVFDPGIGPRH